LCERASDCALAPELAGVLGRVLGEKIPVNDISARYEATTRSRQLHFELWFDRQPISVAGATPLPVPAATPASPADGAATGPTPGVTSTVAVGTTTAPLTLTITRPVPVAAGDSVTLGFSPLPAAAGSNYAVLVDGVPATVIQSANGIAFIMPTVSRNLLSERSVPFEIIVANQRRISPSVSLTVSSWISVLSPWLAALSAALMALTAAWTFTRRRAATRETGVSGATVPAPPPTIADSVPSARDLRRDDAATPSSDPLVDTVVAQYPWEPDPPEKLVEAVAGRQAVLVVGAGASELSGLLTPSQFILQLLRRLGPRTPKSVIALVGEEPTEAGLAAITARLGGSGKLFEAVISAVPRETVIDLLRETLPIQPSALHDVLGQLPWRAIVDLNLDDLMVGSLAAHRQASEQAVLEATVNETQDVLRSFRSGETILFRPYGANDQPTTLALTAEEMRRSVSRAPDFQRALSALLQTQPFLFVGTTPEAVEQFFYAVAPDHSDKIQRHYLFLPRDPVNALSVSTLARFGVMLLEYDPQPDGSGPYRFSRNLLDRVNDVAAAGEVETTSRFVLSPSRVSRIRLQNIGPFDDIELHVSDGHQARPFDDAGDDTAVSPWWVLFGGNGVGKSTVLRSLAVVLAGDTPASAAAGRRLLKTDRPFGLIEVQIGSQTLTTRIQSERSSVIVTPSQKSPVELGSTLALGFPALRGARTPDPTGPSARHEIREPEPADLQQLIASEVDGRLSDFKQWLVNTLTSAERDPRAAEMRQLLNDLIREIIPGQIDALAPLKPGDFVIRVQTPDGEVPFDELSQGMASIFNWVGLLVQRLFTICERSSRPQDEPAIVIIDEIDAHLHPEWQRRLVPLTRKFFPNVQVIATSHSPLLAGSLRLHEMSVLARDADTGRVEAVRHGATYGLMSQDIMTSGVFAMATDRNPEVELMIQRYCSLYEARERSPEQERELVRLREQLDRYGYGAKASIDPPIVDDDHIEKLRRRFTDGEAAPA
jgi:energy-coupling factor transporter ATP-binding protein EcfA2